MRNFALKSSVYFLVGISAAAWCSLAYLEGLDLSRLIDFFGLIPKVVTIDLLAVAVFVRWGWKLKIFRGWLVPFPDLNGSWVGFIYSDWENPTTKEKPDPIPVMLTVKQSFFHISCMARTDEMEGYSHSESFFIDPGRQIKNITYLYTSKPRISLSKRSIPHDGAAAFKIVEGQKQKLIGRYWTDILSKGEIILEYYSKEMLEELPEHLGEHPVTENENRR
jgi:hypothetical protein